MLSLGRTGAWMRTFVVGILLLTVPSSAWADLSFFSSSGTDPMWVTDGNVNAAAAGPDGNIYFGGDFTVVAPETGAGAVFESATGTRELSFPKVEGGRIESAAADGNGGWYIGGLFTSVGGYARSNLAHIDANNRVTAWNPGANNVVGRMLLSGTTLYVGGSFTTIGGASRSRIAALDTTVDTNNATAWNPGASEQVWTMALSGTTLYVGGAFTTIGGASRNYIAALDTTVNTTNTTAWNPGASDAVRSLAVSPSLVYAGGLFTTIAGASRNRLAALDRNTNTTNTTAWNPNVTGSTVHDMELSGNILYIVGFFETVAGVSRHYAAALYTNINTNNATPWDPQATDFVQEVVLGSPGRVFVGGRFEGIDGYARTRLAAISASDRSMTAWNPAADEVVSAIAVSGTAVYAGGSFTTIGGAARQYLAALSTVSTTNNAFSWNPSSDAPVRAIVPSGGTVYVGGDFTVIGGESRAFIAELSANTGLATSWDPSADSPVTELALSGTSMFVGGGFTNIGGQPRNFIAELDTTVDTNNATNWDPGADNTVYALVVTSSRVYAGGMFTSIGGQARNGLAALERSTDTNNATSWDPQLDMTDTTDMVLDGDVLYVAGGFANIDGNTRDGLAAYDTASDVPRLLSWQPSVGTPAFVLTRGDSRLFVGTTAGLADFVVGVFEELVNITGTVPAALSFQIRNADDTATASTCALGALSASASSTCAYRLRIATNASSGYTVSVKADHDLATGSATMTSIVNDVAGGFVAGTEAYGISLLSAATVGGRDTNGGFTNPAVEASASPFTFATDPSPVPTSTFVTLLSSANGFSPGNAPSATSTSLVTHAAAISGGTPAGNYSQTVTYLVTPVF